MTAFHIYRKLIRVLLISPGDQSPFRGRKGTSSCANEKSVRAERVLDVHAREGHNLSSKEEGASYIQWKMVGDEFVRCFEHNNIFSLLERLDGIREPI